MILCGLRSARGEFNAREARDWGTIGDGEARAHGAISASRDRIFNTMSERAEEALGPKQKIDILLKEYDTLRAETVVRVAGVHQSVSIGIAAFTWLASMLTWFLSTQLATPPSKAFSSWTPVFVSIILCFVMLAAVLIWFAYAGARDQRMISLRLGQLERQINALAGANLLCWESNWGMLATGHVRRSSAGAVLMGDVDLSNEESIRKFIETFQEEQTGKPGEAGRT